MLQFKPLEVISAINYERPSVQKSKVIKFVVSLDNFWNSWGFQILKTSGNDIANLQNQLTT